MTPWMSVKRWMSRRSRFDTPWDGSSPLVIGGLQKNSLIDYPGKMSCVLFLCGCNFHCPYCHNPDLAQGCPSCKTRVSMEEVFDFLERRRGLLDGVVVSGGEPTLSPDLPDLCAHIREMDYSLKLDTNGSRPRMLQEVLDAGLVDYVAMDVKTDPQHYSLLAGESGTTSQVLTSIRLIMESGVDYEFRTTCVRPFVTESSIHAIAHMIQGARRYILQNFHTADVLSPDFFENKTPAFEESDLRRFQAWPSLGRGVPPPLNETLFPCFTPQTRMTRVSLWSPPLMKTGVFVGRGFTPRRACRQPCGGI